MHTERSLPYHYEQLLRWAGLETPTLQSKLIIVPSIQVGYELTTAMAALSKGWLNIYAMPLKNVADGIVEQEGGWSDYSHLSSAAIPFLFEHLLRGRDAVGGIQPGRAAGTLAGTIRDLRMAGISPGEYAQVAEGRFHQVALEVYESYLKILVEFGLLDDAALLQRATELLKADFHVNIFDQIAIFDEIELTSVELDFVRVLEVRVENVWRIGRQRAAPHHSMPLDSQLSSALSAADRLSDWQLPPSSVAREPDGREIRVIRAVGAENEIRAVFRMIIESGLSLDQVEIAYSARDPYTQIARTLSNRYGVPMTIAAGMRAVDTRAGATARAFFRWIRDGKSSTGLVQMLRSGLIDLSAGADFGADMLDGIPTMMARIPVSGDIRNYGRALSIVRAQIEKDLESAKGSFAEAGVHEQENTCDLIESLVWPLLNLAGRLEQKGSLGDVHSILSVLLYRYVGAKGLETGGVGESTPRETQSNEDELEYVARQELISRFAQLADEVNVSLPISILLGRTLDVITEAVVYARSAQPGMVHLVPLSSAGFSGRRHLYVVGMDNQTSGGGVSEDPLLSDEERQSLGSQTKSLMNLSSDRSGAYHRKLKTAVSRFDGFVTFVYSTYDIAKDRELAPSASLLSVSGINEEAGQLTPVHSFRPDFSSVETSVIMDTADLLLAVPWSQEARRLSGEKYPWLESGRQASLKRTSSEWSIYDGLLGAETKKLNPFSGSSRLSASRLETLTRCPFKYFLSYILRVRAPDEPDPVVWIDAAARGTLIHSALQQFMSESLNGGRSLAPEERDRNRDRLLEIFSDEIEEFESRSISPDPAAKERLLRDCEAVVDAFVAGEARRQEFATPVAFEFGFGVWPFRRKSELDSTDVFKLNIEGLEFNFSGWVDRIDRLSNGSFAITDYKTGSSRGFDPDNLLDGGRSLQWALYAYAVETIMSGPVDSSGYLFPNARELGRRVESDPALVKTELTTILRRAGLMAQAGMFLPAADANGVCRYCDFKRICGDLGARKRTLEDKLAATKPGDITFEALSNWPYAHKKLDK